METGEVDWGTFFGQLNDAGFAGEMVTEREAGSDRIEKVFQALIDTCLPISV